MEKGSTRYWDIQWRRPSRTGELDRDQPDGRGGEGPVQMQGVPSGRRSEKGHLTQLGFFFFNKDIIYY